MQIARNVAEQLWGKYSFAMTAHFHHLGYVLKKITIKRPGKGNI